MRKSSTILEELNENKELAKATGLAADEKDFIEGEIADLEKEYEAALEAEKKAQKPKKKETEPVNKQPAAPKKEAPVETPATEKPKKAKKAPKTQDEMAFIVYKGKKIYENEPEYCEKSIEAWKERKAAQKKAAGKYKTKPVIQKVASNIVSAVAKGIDTIKHEDIKGNPKEAIKKMEQLEKAGKQFLEAYKNILGEKISDKAIKEEFEGLDETIKKISEKYLAEKTKFENGGSTLERRKIKGKVKMEISVPFNYEKVVADEFRFTEFLSKTLTKKWFGNGVWGVKILKPLFLENNQNKVVLEIDIPLGVTQSGGIDEFEFIEFLSKTLTKKWFGNGVWGVKVIHSLQKMANGGEVESEFVRLARLGVVESTDENGDDDIQRIDSPEEFAEENGLDFIPPTLINDDHAKLIKYLDDYSVYNQDNPYENGDEYLVELVLDSGSDFFKIYGESEEDIRNDISNFLPNEMAIQVTKI